jgi:AraC-like DNA-binding protein
LTAEQEPFLAVRSWALTYENGERIEPHTHAWHQLLYGLSGAMTVFAGRFCWMVPPAHAVFIPARVAHSIHMWGDVAMRSLYLRPDLPGLQIPECRVIAVAPLFREVIVRVTGYAALDTRAPAEQHLLSVLLDEIGAAPESPAMLPVPAGERTLAVARHILENPATQASVSALGRRFGLSARTLERRFREETGMRLVLWRQKARLLEAVRLLAAGAPVTRAALDCGYSSVSGFIAMFGRTWGSPRGWVARAYGGERPAN